MKNKTKMLEPLGMSSSNSKIQLMFKSVAIVGISGPGLRVSRVNILLKCRSESETTEGKQAEIYWTAENFNLAFLEEI